MVLSEQLKGHVAVYSPKDESDHRHHRCRPTVREPTRQPRGRFWELLEEPVVKHGPKSRQNMLFEIHSSLLVDSHCLDMLEGSVHLGCLQRDGIRA